MPRNVVVEDFLNDCHVQLSMSKEKKCLEDDFTAFKKIMLRGLAYAWDLEINSMLDLDIPYILTILQFGGFNCKKFQPAGINPKQHTLCTR